MADLGYRREVRGGNLESRGNQLGPCLEECDRIGVGQRRDWPPHLACHSERFAARRDDAQGRRDLKHGLAKLRTCGNQVLAVVQDQKCLLGRQPGRYDLIRRTATGKLESRDHRRGDVAFADEVYPRDTVRPEFRMGLPDLRRKAALARSAGAHQSDQPR